jgi:hypothetical protein
MDNFAISSKIYYIEHHRNIKFLILIFIRNTFMCLHKLLGKNELVLTVDLDFPKIYATPDN